MTEKTRDVESIVQAARQIPGRGEREAYIANACAGDERLRERLEKMLSAETGLSSFSRTDETHELPSGSRGLSSTAPTAALSSSEQPGTIIGRYKILQQIGEGGFGVVHMAEQEQPVRRKVALKIIKLGMDTRQVIARFEQERQALAMMDHPNIAKVLDAGATDAGRPYFVMELVKGVPITEYCNKQNLSFHDRLNLFIQVCSAVQHAHQKGIIHRDIKPNNVLVTHVDDRPVPKVIDFGIAKATEQRLTERTMFTEFGQFMGTPAYMSPEQVDPIGLDIDTRSDIYSLGVLLYELLTGATPFDVKTLRGAALDEIKRVIQEHEPSKPSTRLSTLGDDLASVAKQRGVEPKKLGTVLRGDLDWIIMRALEKDRTRRYDSATDFARDIERYLNHEPVNAGPPSASYRLQKFVRRNRKAVAVSAVAAAALVGFAVTMTVQAGRIAAERDRANHEREMSDRVVEFQASMLRAIKPLKLGESIATDLRSRIGESPPAGGEADEQREAALASLNMILSKVNLTDTARAVLDANILAPAATAVEKQFAAQPQAEARLQYALARTYLVLGLPDQALSRAQRALDLQREHLGEEHRDTLRTLNAYAMILFDLDRNDECGAILRKTIASFERVFGPEDTDTLKAKGCLAALGVDRGIGIGGRKQYEELIEAQERVLGGDSVDLAGTLMNFGIVLMNQHHDAEAIPVLERALNIHIESSGRDEAGALSAMQNLATAYQAVGRSEDAAKLQSEAMERLERTRGTGHPGTIDAVANLADLYKAKGDYQKAEPIAKKALEMQRAVYGDSHRKTLKTTTDVGIILGMLGRHAEAEAYHVDAYERVKAAHGADHTETMDNLNNLAVHYWYLGQYQKALELFAENLAGLERRYGKDRVETTYAMANLAIVYTKLGRLDDSQAILDKALAIRTKAYGTEHAKTLETRASLAHLTYERGHWDKAEQLYVDLIAAQKKAFGPEHPYTLEATYNLAIVTEKLGRNEEAEKLLAAALEGRRRVVGTNHSETLDTASELARLRFDAGKAEEARMLFKEVIAARREAASSGGASAAQLHSCARVLLTCTVEDLRNPVEALQYAERAAAATNYGDAAYLNTLARALFDGGHPEKAIEMQRKAVSLLPEGSPARDDYEKRLAEYSAGDDS